MRLVLVPRTQLSARLSQRSALKAKSLTWLPGNVRGSSPIVVTANGLSYTVSLDLQNLIASLNIYYRPIIVGLDEQIIADHTRLAAIDGEASALHREHRRGEVRASLLVSDAMALAAGVDQRLRRRIANEEGRASVRESGASALAASALEKVRRQAASDQIALLAEVFS